MDGANVHPARHSPFRNPNQRVLTTLDLRRRAASPRVSGRCSHLDAVTRPDADHSTCRARLAKAVTLGKLVAVGARDEPLTRNARCAASGEFVEKIDHMATAMFLVDDRWRFVRFRDE